MIVLSSIFYLLVLQQQQRRRLSSGVYVLHSRNSLGSISSSSSNSERPFMMNEDSRREEIVMRFIDSRMQDIVEMMAGDDRWRRGFWQHSGGQCVPFWPPICLLYSFSTFLTTFFLARHSQVTRMMATHINES
jgi:hypothetical protein